MTDDHQYNLRQRTQPPIPLGLAVTTSSSYLPPQPSQPQQSEQSPVQITSSLDQTETESDRQSDRRPVPTVASLPGVVDGFVNVSPGIDLASRPTDQSAVVPVSEQSNFASVGLKPLTSGLLHQVDASPAVSSEYVAFVPGTQQEAALVDRAAVVDSAVVGSTDEADPEVASYYRDTTPTLQPAPFCYDSPPPRADDVHSRTASRQLRPTSRQSVLSVHSRAVGGQSRASSRQSRQSVRSQPTDPVVDLMNRMFEQVAGDAAAQRADAAAQRADADRRELQLQADADKRELQRRADADRLQANMEAEMARREQEATEKARLQMRVQQLEDAARLQTECTPPPPPLAVQQDSPPPVARGVTQVDRGPATAMPAASMYANVHAQPRVTAAPVCVHASVSTDSGHAAMTAASAYTRMYAQPRLTAAPAGAHALASTDRADMQQLLTSRASAGDAHVRSAVTVASSPGYNYSTVPAQADRVLTRTPLALADLTAQFGLLSALAGASALPTAVHAASASMRAIGTGQPGPQLTELTDSRRDLTLPQYTMPPPAAASVLAYTQQPWATDMGHQSDHVINERLSHTAYDGTIFASRPSQYISVSTAADSQTLVTRPLALGLAGPGCPYPEPTQTKATHRTHSQAGVIQL